MRLTSRLPPLCGPRQLRAVEKSSLRHPRIRKEPHGHKDHAVKEAGAFSATESASIRARHEHAREPFRAAPPRGYRRCLP